MPEKASEQKKRTGRSRKGGIGPKLDYFNGSEGLFFGEAKRLPLAEYNPYANQRFIDQDDTIEYNRNKISTLSHEEALVYKDGYAVSGCLGGKHSVALTDEFVDNIKGNYMTHNHPSGGTFSFVDLQILYNQPDTMEACGHKGYYTMRLTNKADVDGFINAIRGDRDKIEDKMSKARHDAGRAYGRGLYKDKAEADQDSVNRQLEVIHKTYEKYAGQYGIEYKYHPNDAGLQEKRNRDMIDAQTDFMFRKKKVAHPEKYDKYAGSKKGHKRMQKNIKRDGFEGKVIYNDGEYVIRGYENEKTKEVFTVKERIKSSRTKSKGMGKKRRK